MKITEKLKKLPKATVISLIGCLCFLLILWNVFTQTTYLFRNERSNAWRLSGFKSERHDPDLFYVGGSISYSNWFPLTAWGTYGFTSYDLATQSIPAENIRAYIEYARSYKDTKLFVIDARPFEYYSGGDDEMGLRYGSDGMDLTSPARYRMLHEYFSRRSLPKETDILSYYLDISKYHTNTAQLADDSAWENKTNQRATWDKGAYLSTAVCRMEEPTGFLTSERGNLNKNAQELLTDLLDYGQREGLQFLFVVSPYRIQQSQQKEFNTIRDIVESYGQGFWNANEYYAQIGTDFSQDFGDSAHANLSGGEKCTLYLARYLKERYDLPDHRDDPDYADWRQDYAAYAQNLEKGRSKLLSNLAMAEETASLAEAMRQTDNPYTWYTYTNSDLFAVAVVSGDVTGEAASLGDRKFLGKLGLSGKTSWQMRLLRNDATLFSNAETDVDTLREPFGFTDSRCGLSIQDGACYLWTDAQELDGDPTAINLVVLNTYNGAIEDYRTIRFDPEGALLFSQSARP